MADMGTDIRLISLFGCRQSALCRVLSRQIERRQGCLFFGKARPTRQSFDAVAVVVPRFKVHARVDSRRIPAEDLLDNGESFHKVAPVDARELAQAAHAVADGELIFRLSPALPADHLAYVQAAFGQPFLKPGQGQGGRGVPALQPAREFGHKGAGQGHIRIRHFRHGRHHVFSIPRGGFQQSIRPARGRKVVAPRRGHAGGRPAQILHQRQPQHDGDGPQFPEREGRRFLIRRDETPEHVGIEPAVAVRDVLQGDIVYAGKPGRRAVGQARQFPAVLAGQVGARGADLLFHQVGVVQQPFAGRHDAPLALHARGFGKHLNAGAQHVFVVVQAKEQAVGGRTRIQPVAGGEFPRMGGHLIGVEEPALRRRLYAQPCAGETILQAFS